MTSILLLGGGGHCKSCIDVLEHEGRYLIEGVVVGEGFSAESVLGYPVLGTNEDLPRLLETTPHALVCVGQIMSPRVRVYLFDSVKALHGFLPVVVSPKAHVSKHAELGEGSIVMHGAVINASAQVGANCIVNSLSLIEHDAIVGANCHISTGVRLNGGVVVGDGSFIGSGSIVKENVSIGPGAVIGAGCVIKRDVPAGSLVKASVH